MIIQCRVNVNQAIYAISDRVAVELYGQCAEHARAQRSCTRTRMAIGMKEIEKERDRERERDARTTCRCMNDSK